MYFTDVPLNGSFVIDTEGSKGAVYRKVDTSEVCTYASYAQLEEATGKLFKTTASPVRLVGVEIKIDAKKPNIVGY